LSHWALIILAIFLGMLAWGVMRRRY